MVYFPVESMSKLDEIEFPEIPIMDRYSNGSYIIKDKIKSSYLESTMLTKEDFQNLEYVEDKKSEQVELNFDMLNKEPLLYLSIIGISVNFTSFV